MKKIALFAAFSLSILFVNAQKQKYWSPEDEASIGKGINLFQNKFKPQNFKLFSLDYQTFKQVISQAPLEKIVSASKSEFIITIPTPEGNIEKFRIVEAPIFEKGLAEKYPDIKSYAGQGIDKPGSIIRFDFSPYGFNAIIFPAEGQTIYINALRKDVVAVFYKSNEIKSAFKCGIEEKFINQINQTHRNGSVLKNADDGRLRTFRLAAATNGEFSQKALDGTETSDAERKSKVLAAINTDLTRANGIYEKDFGIRMLLVTNEDQIIYLYPASDPWTSSSQWNSGTQTTIDNVIGNANYDIGHLLAGVATTSGNNGNAGCIGCVCVTGSKGSGFTAHTDLTGDPLVVDYWTHEMGHQFGANHTFTFQNEGTGVNMEPGSGSTIMGYAGITGSTDVQPHSDDYFHAASISQITDYIKTAPCAVSTITGDNTPTANAGLDYTIPKSTAFALNGTGTDADASDVLTYTWEQYDTYASGSNTFPSATATSGPVFRSILYSTNPTRVFPNLTTILAGNTTNTWEAVPSVARALNFRFTVRDNHAGGGNNNSDDMKVTVSSASGPFAVTAPNTNVSWAANSSQTITWNVASSNLSPVNCANVKISLSADGGNTFPNVLSASTPNDGSETLTMPNITGTQCRVKIEAVGNIFFDISNTNFTLTAAGACNAPSGLATSGITSSTATVSWSAVSGAISYDVDYKLTSTSTWTNAATGTTSISVNLSGLTASTTYDWQVRTNCSSGSSAYSAAQFTTATTGGGCQSSYDNVANESFAQAVTIPTNTDVTGLINTTTDNDYYSVTLASAGTLTVTLTTLPGDYDLKLYNSAQTQLAVSQNGGTTSETITYTATAGTYYIRVYGYNGANSTTNCYTLKAAFSASTCPGTYDNSTNGTFSGAVQIPLNTDVKGLINTTTDVDFSKFTITNGGTLTVNLTTLPADYDVRLYNSSQTQVGISQNGGTTSEAINYTASAGTYYVKVYGYNGARSTTVCYTLRITTGTASKNIFAANNNVKIFPNPVQSVLTVNTSSIKNNVMITVYDEYSKPVLNKSAQPGTTQLDVKKLAPGIYYLTIKDEGGKIMHTEKFVKQ